MSRTTIGLGGKDLRGTVAVAAPDRVRRAGGGRTKTVAKDPSVRADLERLGELEPSARGDPQSPLRWTGKGGRTLAAALGQRGHQLSPQWVAPTLEKLGYRVQANRKTREGGDHAARDAPFAHLPQSAQPFLAAGEPVIAVDAKTKELVGAFTNEGTGRRLHEGRTRGAAQGGAGGSAGG